MDKPLEFIPSHNWVELKEFAQELGYKVIDGTFKQRSGYDMEVKQILLPYDTFAGIEYGICFTHDYFRTLKSHGYVIENGELDIGEEIYCYKTEHITQTTELEDKIYLTGKKEREYDGLYKVRSLMLAFKFKELGTLDPEFLGALYKDVLGCFPKRKGKKLVLNKLSELEEKLEEAKSLKFPEDEIKKIRYNLSQMAEFYIESLTKAGIRIKKKIIHRLRSKYEQDFIFDILSTKEGLPRKENYWPPIATFAEEQGFEVRNDNILLPLGRVDNIEYGACIRGATAGYTINLDPFNISKMKYKFISHFCPYVMINGKLRFGQTMECFTPTLTIKTAELIDRKYVIGIERREQQKNMDLGEKARALILAFKFKELGTIDPSFINDFYTPIIDLLPKNIAKKLIENKISELEEKANEVHALSSGLPRSELDKIFLNIGNEITIYYKCAVEAKIEIDKQRKLLTH